MQDDLLLRWPRALKAWFVALVLVGLLYVVGAELILMVAAPEGSGFRVGGAILSALLIFMCLLVSILPTFIMGSAAVVLREVSSRSWRVAGPAAMILGAALLSVSLSDDLLPSGLFSDQPDIESAANPKSFAIRFALTLLTHGAVFLTARQFLLRRDRAGRRG